MRIINGYVRSKKQKGWRKLPHRVWRRIQYAHLIKIAKAKAQSQPQPSPRKPE
jgi:hypothetical protein